MSAKRHKKVFIVTTKFHFSIRSTSSFLIYGRFLAQQIIKSHTGNLHFVFLAYTTRFPTVFSQSSGFRLTGLKETEAKMIEKNVSPTEEENMEVQHSDKLVNIRLFVT